MNSLFWERAHGGLTHFPIALIFVATLFDLLSLVRDRSSKGRDFKAIGYWLVILAALGAVAAVLSGLGLSKWKVMGTGLMRLHHLFVWPAFALILALTAWRVAARNEFSRRAFTSYLITACCACALIGAAGFVGGEMLLGETTSTAPSGITAPSSNAQVSQVMLADATQGRHLFLMNCAHCHGDDAHGDEGPDLYDLHKSDARIHKVVTEGIKGEMPSFAKKLNDTDVRALIAYLHTLKT
jgi:mono/diheme cytochrome c family protein